MLMFVVVIGGFVAELVGKKLHRNPLGLVAIAALVAVGVIVPTWMWENVDNQDAVNVILTLIVVAVAAFLAMWVVRMGAVPRAV